VPVRDDTEAYRGRLPHLLKSGRMYYVTFCTVRRECLSANARDVVLASCIHDHDVLCWIDCVVVMPDHVHLIVAPYEQASLSIVLKNMKSRSAIGVNRLMKRAGSLWQRESFDRIVRSTDNLERNRQYIFENPVRAGLVKRVEDYPWIWSPP